MLLNFKKIKNILIGLDVDSLDHV